jgi:hypothetical protein
MPNNSTSIVPQTNNAISQELLQFEQSLLAFIEE